MITNRTALNVPSIHGETISHLTIFLTSSMTELHGNNNAKSIVLPGHNIQLDQPRSHLKGKRKILTTIPHCH